MPCLTDEVWDAFSVRRLPEPEWLEVRRHLDECADCRERWGWTEVTQATPAEAALPSHDSRIGALERGSTVGRYLILDLLGSGGMGLVYAAFDPELDRKVAVKLLRADIGSGERGALYRARLAREAQAMARLSHPNVIPVYDVGTIGDRLFVAMELVEGPTAKRWARAQPRPWREVLEVYAQAGRGLEAAHQAGLVHRDFKPDNVLVGNDGRVRVTDFGLARVSDATELPSLGDDAPTPSSAALHQPITRHGSVMGTPGYMSPEQCRGEVTDARSDQFSFCASLYEALYGERAFAGKTAEELMQAVQTGQVRPPPSTTEVPAWLRKVVLRGLKYDPAQRWPSIGELLRALERDPRQRARRFAIVGTTLALAALAVGGTWLRSARQQASCRAMAHRLDEVWNPARKTRIEAAFARTGKPYAARAWQEVARIVDRYAAAWSTMSVEACEDTRLRHAASETTLGLRVACLDRRRKQLAALTEQFVDADSSTVEGAVRAAGELEPVASCGDVEQLGAQLRPPADAHTRADVDALETELARAGAMLQSGRYAAGIAVAQAIVPRARATGYRPVEARTLELLGRLEHKASDYQAADRALKQALFAAEEARDDAVKIMAATRLANVSVDLHGFDVAHDWLRLARATLARVGSPVDLELELLDAEATVNFREGRYHEAEQPARAAVALAEKTFGERDLRTALAWRTLGDTLAWSGQYAEALAAEEKARVTSEALLGTDHPEIGVILRKEADAWAMQHDGARELELSRRALAIFSRSLAPDHLWIAQVHTSAAEALGFLGRFDEAIAEERLALPIYQQRFGPESENVGVSLTNIGWAEARLGRLDDARRDLARAVAIYEQALAPDAVDLAEPLLRLGEVALSAKRPREALPYLERAWKLRQKDGDPLDLLAEIELTLAEALDQCGRDRTRARALAQSAEAQLRAGGRGADATRAAALLARLR